MGAVHDMLGCGMVAARPIGWVEGERWERLHGPGGLASWVAREGKGNLGGWARR
jgi:hypothetical protein